ncbi:hypothetical protein L580_0737 [Serratia fonticola AU-P3(3)]|nr:hypothetical protein L580_0737 [Serratia fonticola AU-P3(3)]
MPQNGTLDNASFLVLHKRKNPTEMAGFMIWGVTTRNSPLSKIKYTNFMQKTNIF